MTRRIISNSFLQSIPFEKLERAMNTPPHQHDNGKWYYELQSEVDDTDHIEIKPRYQVGDEVYVAEGYQCKQYRYGKCYGLYLADNKPFEKRLTFDEYTKLRNRKFPHRPTPGRFMYKSLARTFMKITEVRVERVQEIHYRDLWKEGLRFGTGAIAQGYLQWKNLWNSIRGNGAWDRNDWVWVYKWVKE